MQDMQAEGRDLCAPIQKRQPAPGNPGLDGCSNAGKTEPKCRFAGLQQTGLKHLICEIAMMPAIFCRVAGAL